MRALALLPALALAACQIPSEQGFKSVMDTSIGKPEASVIRMLGVPDRTYQTGGSKFLFYRQQNISSAYGGVATYTCDMTFELVGGVVRDWRASGNACRH